MHYETIRSSSATSAGRSSLVRYQGRTSQISDIPVKDLAEAMSPKQRAEIAAKLGVKPAPSLSRADLEHASNRATNAERARVKAVFDSPHSVGRERACARLLGQQFTAGQIVAALPTMPSDAETVRTLKAERQAAADAMWDKAHAKLGGN